MSTRYMLHETIGSGGMATVHLGQLQAPLGFSRVVAIKRLHPALSHQPEFAAMLVDEARITARVRHPNVIPTLDVFVEEGECFLVMEYVEGESLAKLLRAASQAQAHVPLPVVSAVIVGVLHGLHAAHVAKSTAGEPLNIIHRDVSPQNILVGSDGVPRIFDFGVAKALGRLQQTRAGEFKGKLPYLAPEQFSHGAPDHRVDIYAASVTLWEALTARRLFDGSEEEVFGKILQSQIPAPSELRPELPSAIDELVLRGLSRSPSARFQSAEEMALLLERAVPPASPREVAAWVHGLAGEALARRAELVSQMDGGASASARALLSPLPPAEPARLPLTSPPVADLQARTVTQRITVPLRTLHRQSAAPVREPESPPSALQPPPEAAEAPTVVGSRLDTPPPLSVVVTDNGSRRTFAVRTIVAATVLLCALAAPAFGWMAFSDRSSSEENQPAASPPAAIRPAATRPSVAASVQSPSSAPAPVRLATTPPAPSTAVSSAPPTTSSAATLTGSSASPPHGVGAPTIPVAPTPAVSAKRAATSATKPSPARADKPKPAASVPDYLSSRAYSQRR
jgi:serine/threonine-protein kinase